jgi:RNA polymerase sigma-70 factor (ECF subfamily)
VVSRRGRPFAVAGLTVVNGKVAEIDLLTDPERLAALDLTVLDD